MGLFGNMLVDSPDRDYYSPVNREETLLLDDLLVNGDTLIPFGKEAPDYALMGRVGNVLLVNGEPRYALRAKRGEVVRYFITNVSSSRTFNLSFGGAPIKVVASDVSRFEREERVPSVVHRAGGAVRGRSAVRPAGALHRGERDPGDQPLRRRVLRRRSTRSASSPSTPRRRRRTTRKQFATLRANAQVSRDIDRYRSVLRPSRPTRR